MISKRRRGRRGLHRHRGRAAGAQHDERRVLQRDPVLGADQRHVGAQLDPDIFGAEPATNLTLIIQGLIVRPVSAPVIVTTLYRLRPKCSRPDPEVEVKITAALVGASTSAARTAPCGPGLSGVALGVFAAALRRPAATSHAGALARDRGGGRPRAVDGARGRGGGGRLGAVVAGVIGAVGAMARTQSRGHQRRRRGRAGLAATPRFATPLASACSGGIVSERSAGDIGLEGMMLCAASSRSTARKSRQRLDLVVCSSGWWSAVSLRSCTWSS